MTALDEARDALHTFAESQGWEIRSNIVGGIAILATINLAAPCYICNTCGRNIEGREFASLGRNVVLCIPCYDTQEEGR